MRRSSLLCMFQFVEGFVVINGVRFFIDFPEHSHGSCLVCHVSLEFVLMFSKSRIPKESVWSIGHLECFDHLMKFQTLIMILVFSSPVEMSHDLQCQCDKSSTTR